MAFIKTKSGLVNIDQVTHVGKSRAIGAEEWEVVAYFAAMSGENRLTLAALVADNLTEGEADMVLYEIAALPKDIEHILAGYRRKQAAQGEAH